MKVWGLTGNIACGKSAVEGFLREADVPVIDADQVARTIVEPGSPALAEIAQTFGPGVLDDQGRLNRPALGQLVFSDAEARKSLEAITHPRIHTHITEQLAELAKADTPLAVVSAALMVESGSYRLYEGMIVVTCPEDEQLRRLKARDGFDEVDARARIASQMSQTEKAALADVVVDNGGSLLKTEQQVKSWLSSLP